MNTMLSYEGYQAKVEYDADSDAFVGKVLGVADQVEFKGKSTEELKKQLQKAVDAYLKKCQKEGCEPRKPYSGKLALRLPAEMHQALHIQSEALGVSINELIITAIGGYLAREWKGEESDEYINNLPFSYGFIQLTNSVSDKKKPTKKK